MNRFTKFATAVVVAALVLAAPAFGADFSRFVALGDSTGAGFTNASLNERHQGWSFPAIIARQAGVPLCQPTASAADPCFAQPLVTFPGIGPELQLLSLAPTIAPAAGLGSPVMLNFRRPYNNLSIPGATVAAMLALTGAEPPQAGEPTAVTMGRFILRGQGSAVAQAVAQDPTLAVVWLGNNDALSTMFSGTPATLTPAADFAARYQAILNALDATGADIVVGNIPTQPLPYMLLIPTYIVNPATGRPVPDPDGNPIPLIAELGDGTVGLLRPGSFVLLHARANLATGYGLPNVPPFNLLPNAGKPLPDSDVIDAAEYAAIVTRIGEYNAAIQSAASARGIPVANVAGVWNRVYSQGYHVGPITVSAAPITGGFFGLDFFHPTDLGYLLIANEYIRTINEAYDDDIPLASVAQLFANNGAFFPDTPPNAQSLTDAALAQIRSLWAQPTLKKRPITISIR